MPLIELELERDGLLEMDLLGNFIGSAYAPQVDVTETATGHEVAITYDDAATGITTKTFDMEDGHDGADGYSPTATVTQIADGATIRITDKDGTTTATVSNGTDGADGSDGADGFSPTVDVQPIEGGHEVTITDAQGQHSFDVMDGDPAEAGSITDAMLAPDGIKAQVAQLWGNQLKGTLTGDILTTADAYAAPPMVLTVDGRSTQAWTPTPSTPVPIVSVDSVELHASADGTTDYGGWPVPLYDGTLRSLPDGTRDTLALSYLRPSTREGWAWYSREVVQKINAAVFNETYNWSRNSGTEISDGTWRFECNIGNKGQPVSTWSNTNTAVPAYCDHLKAAPTGGLYSGWTNSFGIYQYRLYVRMSGITTLDELKTWIAQNPLTIQYPITPITTQLDPIELPVLPAPTCTVWADPTTGLQMEYVRDTNIVIASLEAAYADLATS